MRQRARQLLPFRPAGITLWLAAAVVSVSCGWLGMGTPLLFCAVGAPPAAESGDAAEIVSEEELGYRSQRIRGRMMWLSDALEQHFGISTVPAVRQNALVLHTEGGELIPIVENARGRAFRKDERLREMDLELLVRRYERHPYVQILGVYEVDGEERFEIDYWCDVCAIVMYESGPCSCCQADNRLRKRKVETP